MTINGCDSMYVDCEEKPIECIISLIEAMYLEGQKPYED